MAKQEVSQLQEFILKEMKTYSTYENPGWGFSAVGFREFAKKHNLKPISVSNAMRSLLKKGVFNNAYAEDQYDDTTYFLPNPNFKKCK